MTALDPPYTATHKGLRSNDDPPNSVVASAVQAVTSFSYFPLLPQTKIPALAWDGYKTGHLRADAAQVDRWRAAGNNLAVATGAVSNCVVLDCDSLAAWGEAISRGVPDSYTVTTPRGFHLYYLHPGGHVGNRAKLGGVSGWDIRGDGGYVVAPGSYYAPSPEDAAKGKTAGSYAVEHDLPLAPAPQWLLDLLVKDAPHAPPAPHVECEQTTPYGRSTLNLVLTDLTDARAGENLSDTIYRAAARIAELVAGGEIRYDEGWESLEEAMRRHGVADEEKAQGTLSRGWEKGWSNPKRAPERAVPTADAVFGQRDLPDEDDQPLMAVPEPPKAFGPTLPTPAVVGAMDTADYFRGCTYVASDNAIWVPGGVMLKRDAFNVIYGGPTFYLTGDNAKPSRNAWDLFGLNEVHRLPRAMRTVFRPECPAGGIQWLEGLPVLNAYEPIRTPTVEGDAEPFLRHVHKLLPHGDDAKMILHWMASCVQNPGAKFQWWPVIQGTKGNGKTLLLDVMFAAVGERYSHLVNAEALQRTGNQFNAWIDRKLFLGFEEIHTGEGQHHFTDMMKTTVTNRRIAGEGKGTAQGTLDNRANGIMLTNYTDAVPIDDDERRYGMFFTAQQSKVDKLRDGMGGSYFPNLYAWLRDQDGLAIVTHYLRTYRLDAALDPAHGWDAPFTSSTAAAKTQSLGNIELEVLERIEQGQSGFRGGWIASTAFGQVMERLKVGRKRWPGILTRLGYEPHPGLSDGRVSGPLSDTSRPRLYVTKGHATNELTAGAVGAAYEDAQQLDETISNVVPFGRR